MLTWPWISFRMTHLILFCVAISHPSYDISPLKIELLLLLTFFLWEITRFRHAAVTAAVVTLPDDVRRWLCKIEMRWAKGKKVWVIGFFLPFPLSFWKSEKQTFCFHGKWIRWCYDEGCWMPMTNKNMQNMLSSDKGLGICTLSLTHKGSPHQRESDLLVKWRLNYLHQCVCTNPTDISGLGYICSSRMRQVAAMSPNHPRAWMPFTCLHTDTYHYANSWQPM